MQNERLNNEPLALAIEPGERFRYSGEAFLLLQHALEAITGESLADLCRRLVFEPIGMSRSAFTWRAAFDSNAAVGHGDFRSARRASRPAVARASSSLQTTVHDYAVFLRAVMHGEGLRRETFAEVLTPQVRVAPGIAWGLGWSLEVSDGGRTLWHRGDNSNSGFTAFTLADLGSQDAVLYFANSSAGLSIVRQVLGMIGGNHAAPAFMGYETYDAPSRRVRFAVEEATRTGGATDGLRTYDSLRTQFDSTAFPESLLNNLGYRFLSLDRAADAVALFQRNVSEFPRSSNAFDSLGEGLAAAGNKTAAIASYLRSYELDPRNVRALREAERLRKSP